MLALLRGSELPAMLLLFLFSLYNPREGLKLLQLEIFCLPFFIHVMSRLEGSHANKPQVLHSYT